MNEPIDISSNQRKELLALIQRYLPNVKVWAFGSRVKWTARSNSDLDLVAFAKAEDEGRVSQLKEVLEESSLPFRVDLLVWDNIPESFKKNIQERYAVLVEAEKAGLGWVMNSEWLKVSLDELTDGTTITYGVVKPGEESANGVRFVRGGDVIAGQIQVAQLRTITREVSQQYSRTLLRGGELLVSLVGNPGEVALVPPSLKGANIARQVGLVRLDAKKAYPNYVQFFFRSRVGRDLLLAHSKGSVQQVINLADLKSVRVPLPPMHEQIAIADFMQDIDDRITLLRETNATLEAIAHAIFKSWFVDFDPVKAKIAALAKDRDPLRAAMSAISGKPDAELDALPPEQYEQLAATAELFPDELEESELGEIPKGWVAMPLDGVANFLNGLALQKFPPESATEYLPVIKIAQLRAGHTQGADRAAKSIKPEYVVQDGDVLFSWSGSLEVDVWTGGAGALNQHLFKVTSQHQPKWFYFLSTRHHLPQFREIAANKATTMGHIQRKHLSDALSAVAPAVLMSRATELIDPIVKEMIAVRLQSRELAVIREALLPKLLSGELSVTEAFAESEV